MNYYERARKLATRNTDPTLTDQAGARETDINIIVGRFTSIGTVPGNAGTPMYYDAVGMPTDLRGFIDAARALEYHRSKLPAELKTMGIEELLALTPENVKTILTPPDKKPATTTNQETTP